METLTAMLESFSELIALGNESDAAKLTAEQLQSAAQARSYSSKLLTSRSYCEATSQSYQSYSSELLFVYQHALSPCCVAS